MIRRSRLYRKLIGDAVDKVISEVQRTTLGTPEKIIALYLKNGDAYHKEIPWESFTSKYPQWVDKGLFRENVIDISVEYDGDWNKNHAGQLWRFICQDTPFYFYVNTLGELYVQHDQLFPSDTLLATEVTAISTIRGWKDTRPGNLRDQGLIVAYTKLDGFLYYRTYALQPLTGVIVWEFERQVDFGGPITSFHITKTNDYRVAFAAEVMGEIKLLLTKPLFQGSSVPDAILHWGMELTKFELIPTRKINIEENGEPHIDDHHLTWGLSIPTFDLRYADTPNGFINAENVSVPDINPETEEPFDNWGKRIKVELLHHAYNDVGTATIQVNDDSLTYPVELIEDISNEGTQYPQGQKLLLHVSDFNMAEDKVVTITHLNGLKNGVNVDYDVFSTTFTPINLERPYDPLPEVELMWNE